ncbi:E3 ubiquitin-protein ligase bre1 [Cryomyces antarcticus]|uniref:E3 ubiquitin protein ligase n=1 Tax=Cryomyces antarcticus TaxID=329879 RepID=A0ABR0M7Z8_9PEZI|nr:E3 ubiquitin-protein ligase bre1 [Cryomyces antarcticus]KAK5291599.1 E3 ubiquitin-protein ligase bre1 [Cryomyces antarcticus]
MKDAGQVAFRSSLLFADNQKFEEHLKSRSKDIKSAISQIFGKLTIAPPDSVQLQERLSTLLAAEKVHIAELHRVTTEKEQLSERLENASYRYMVAEKKLERAKSRTVQKLESQAILGGRSETGSGISGEGSALARKESTADSNGDMDNIAANAMTEVARKEAAAVAEKRKEQLDQLEAENKKLTEDLTAMNVKLTALSDDDYAKSELFKLLKSQHEDVIKRINNLESTNVQLREEAQKLQSERTAYRVQMDDESRSVTNEVESQIARAETDLARIRNSRDELAADNAIRKAAQDQAKVSTDQIKELASARENRITALEAEIERLSLQPGGRENASQATLDDMSVEELRRRLGTIENQYALLSNELPSMEAAWKKAQALASKKVAETLSWEEQLSRLGAEKSKADQKYFGAMKAKEAREAENRTLRAQNARSSEIVTQLKEAESSTRSLAVNLEKQVAESKDALVNLSQQHQRIQQKLTERTIISDGQNNQISELKKILAAKDTSTLAAAQAKRQAEVEVEELKVKLEETKKSLEGWKKKGLGNQTDEYEALRAIAVCTVCRKNFKNTAIKTCGHVFCQECVDERISSRSRKCPNCGKAFGSNDHMRVTL